MHTREIAEEYRLTHWAGIMRDRQESGLNIRAYCEWVGFHKNSYYYWQKKLREAACEVTYAKPETWDPVRAVFAKIELPGMAAELPVRNETGENQVSIDIGRVRLAAGGGINRRGYQTITLMVAYMKRKSNHLEDMLVWQETQYTPWQYIAKGKILPCNEAAGNPKLAAIIWFVQAAFSFVVGVVATVGGGSAFLVETTGCGNDSVTYWELEFHISRSWPFIPIFTAFTLFGLFIAGRYWKKYKLQKKLARAKRTRDRRHKSKR